MGHPQAGILPLPDGDGVIKPLPQRPIAGLGLVGTGHLEVLQGQDFRPPIGVKQGLPVGAVVEKEPLVLVTAAKVTAQQRQYSVLRLNFSAQDTGELRESDKTPQEFHLVLQVPDRPEQRQVGLVCETAQQGRPKAVELADEAVHVELLFL